MPPAEVMVTFERRESDPVIVAPEVQPPTVQRVNSTIEAPSVLELERPANRGEPINIILSSENQSLALQPSRESREQYGTVDTANFYQSTSF